MPRVHNSRKTLWALRFASMACAAALAAGCAGANVANGRTVSVPTVTPPDDRYKGLNEERDPVTRVRLGKDVLVPQRAEQDPLPDEEVGPFELRGETLASALQMLLDDYDVSLAFETDKAMSARISVANLRGGLDEVVGRVCDLANLYCDYRKGVLTVKETETFVVDLPPVTVAATSNSSNSAISGGGSSSSSNSNSSSSNSSNSSSSSSNDAEDAYEQIAEGLKAIIGQEPTVDTTTRVIIYTASQRAQANALKYFERLRKNTALIIYETHIWEVTLNNDNRTGIDWSALYKSGDWGLDIKFPGGAPDGGAAPISITPSWTGSRRFTPQAVLEFISEHGTVKTVSQPQLTVLSGSSASLQVEQSENFVSGVSRTPSTVSGVPDTVTTTTQTVQSGLSMNISSAWDRSTVYGAINISINELLSFDKFKPDTNTTIQLPKTTTRGLQTQVRVRPGDAILIGGLVTQKDIYSGSGPGFAKPLLTTSRQAKAQNTELIFLLRPRVVAYDAGTDADTPAAVPAPKEGYISDTPEQIEREREALRVAEDDKPAKKARGGKKVSSGLPRGIAAEALAPAPVGDGPAEGEAKGKKSKKDKMERAEQAPKPTLQEKDPGSADTPRDFKPLTGDAPAEMAPVPLGVPAVPEEGVIVQ